MIKTLLRKDVEAEGAEKGIALLVALFALLLITLLGLALTAMGITAVTITTNERQSAEALYIADSGISHAKRLMLTQPPNNLDVFLQGGDGTACNGDELSDPPPAPFVPADAITAAAAGGHPFPPGGSYQVRVCDDHLVESTAPPDPPDLPDADPNHDANMRIQVVSTAFGRNGAAATLEIIIAAVPLPALVVDGNLRLNGNPSIIGAGGAAHANGLFDLPGVPCAEEFFSATETFLDTAETGTGCAGNPPSGTDSPPDIRPGEDEIILPEIDPASLEPQADYILGDDGRIRDQAGNVIGDANPGTWNGWDWDPGGSRWVAGGGIPGGTYYAEGSNINISGNPGSGPPGTPPLNLTLIAEGWIEISGNPNIIPDLTMDNVTYSMVAGTDLKISGNPGTIFQGLHYAGHQIDFSGNPTLNGQVFGKNLDDTEYPPPPFPGGQNLIERQAGGFVEISGNPTINYDGSGGLVAVRAVAWRECRGPDPVNPCQ